MKPKGSVLPEQAIKLIVVLIIILVAAAIFLVPSYSHAKGIFEIFDWGGKCNVPKVSCENCISVVSVSPASVEFRKSDNWQKSDCTVKSGSISIAFSENLKNVQPNIVELSESCFKDPKNENDWKKMGLLVGAGQLVLKNNALTVSGFKNGCFYRLKIEDGLVGEKTENKVSDELRFISFMAEVKK